jgi:hypothetical protein
MFPRARRWLSLNLAEAITLSTALSQFVENANEDELQTEGGRKQIASVSALLDRVNFFIASFET